MQRIVCTRQQEIGIVLRFYLQFYYLCAPVRDTSCFITLSHLIVDDFHFMLRFKKCVRLDSNSYKHTAHNMLFYFCFSYFVLQTFLSFICLIFFSLFFSRTHICQFIVERQEVQTVHVKMMEKPKNKNQKLTEQNVVRRYFCGHFSSNVYRVYVMLDDCVILF